VWQAESLAAADIDGDLGNYDPDAGYFVVPTPATHVDWGDNMESQTWTATSVIRVETTTFTTLPMTVPNGPLPGRTMRGFQMWHVSGKGPDELWGLRATEPTPATEAGPGVPLAPYVYDSPYAIIHAPNVHLSFTKLDAGGTTCPSAEVPYPSPFTTLVWDEASHKWGTTDTDVWVEHGCVWNDLKYTVELNIGGKFVHGYNWQTSRMSPTICTISGANWTKDGWWRLTYHNATDAVDFSAFVSTVDSLKPPPALPVGPAPVTLLAAEEEEGDTGLLYAPVVDTTNNLTYIDICLKPGRGGGGRR
jgi:hypothetical protein